MVSGGVRTILAGLLKNHSRRDRDEIRVSDRRIDGQMWSIECSFSQGISNRGGSQGWILRTPRTFVSEWTDPGCSLQHMRYASSSTPDRQIVLSGVVSTSRNPTVEITLEIVVIRSSGRVGIVAERCRLLAA